MFYHNIILLSDYDRQSFSVDSDLDSDSDQDQGSTPDLSWLTPSKPCQEHSLRTSSNTTTEHPQFQRLSSESGPGVGARRSVCASSRSMSPPPPPPQTSSRFSHLPVWALDSEKKKKTTRDSSSDKRRFPYSRYYSISDAVEDDKDHPAW